MLLTSGCEQLSVGMISNALIQANGPESAVRTLYRDMFMNEPHTQFDRFALAFAVIILSSSWLEKH
jgi:hypothetical protein